jgi:hypothetical protein
MGKGRGGAEDMVKEGGGGWEEVLIVLPYE